MWMIVASINNVSYQCEIQMIIYWQSFTALFTYTKKLISFISSGGREATYTCRRLQSYQLQCYWSREPGWYDQAGNNYLETLTVHISFLSLYIESTFLALSSSGLSWKCPQTVSNCREGKILNPRHWSCFLFMWHSKYAMFTIIYHIVYMNNRYHWSYASFSCDIQKMRRLQSFTTLFTWTIVVIDHAFYSCDI